MPLRAVRHDTLIRCRYDGAGRLAEVRWRLCLVDAVGELPVVVAWLFLFACACSLDVVVGAVVVLDADGAAVVELVVAAGTDAAVDFVSEPPQPAMAIASA